jgi:hypothetical protein
MTHRLSLLAISCAALALTGCGSQDSETKGKVQSNQVLKGSISDDMIAYDTLTSEPPPAKIAPSEDGAGEDGAREVSDEADGESGGDAQGAGPSTPAQE